MDKGYGRFASRERNFEIFLSLLQNIYLWVIKNEEMMNTCKIDNALTSFTTLGLAKDANFLASKRYII